MAVLETCFVTGMVVPSGLATAVAALLAAEGFLDLRAVAVAAVGGGWLGDSIGYWIGRVGGRGMAGWRPPGRVGGVLNRSVVRARAAASDLFGRHPFFSVTVARLVSFVRTLMPMSAGWGGLRYPRYLAYEAPGVVAWAALYMSIGLLAGPSWRMVTRLVGVGGAAVFVVAALGLWWAHRRRRRRAAAGEVGGAAQPDAAGGGGGGLAGGGMHGGA